MKITMTNADLQFVLETLDGSRAEFEALEGEVDWYVTEFAERCLTAHTIIKNAEKEDNEA